MSETVRPKVWSDFDGTAVQLSGMVTIRNWLKYPLSIKTGYTDFLDGLNIGGADIAGVISRRPNILARRIVTDRSIGKLGLRRFFPKSTVILAGSEASKGAHIAREAWHSVVGLIDDKPHRVGPHVIKALLSEDSGPTGIRKEIYMGVVASDQAADYVDRFAGIVKGISEVEVVDNANHGGIFVYGPNDKFMIEVLPLGHYSTSVGRDFARHLVEAQARLSI